MHASSVLTILTACIATCVLLIVLSSSVDHSIESMSEPGNASGKQRLDDLEHQISTLAGMNLRSTTHREQLRKLDDRLTSYMVSSKSTELANRIPAVAHASVFPTTGQVFPGSKTQPVIWMDGSSFLYGVWVDQTGNGNNARSSLGVKVDTQEAGGAGVSTTFTYVHGGANDALEVVNGWPGDKYTFIHVTKYNGSARGRIWNGKSADVNWLSGHHGGVSGQVYHGDWMLRDSKPAPQPDDWLVVVDTAKSARVNMGMHIGKTDKGLNPMGVAINQYAGRHSDEKSDWATAEVIVFDVELGEDEVHSVETYLHAKYGIAAYPAPDSTGRETTD